MTTANANEGNELPVLTAEELGALHDLASGLWIGMDMLVNLRNRELGYYRQIDKNLAHFEITNLGKRVLAAASLPADGERPVVIDAATFVRENYKAKIEAGECVVLDFIKDRVVSVEVYEKYDDLINHLIQNHKDDTKNNGGDPTWVLDALDSEANEFTVTWLPKVLQVSKRKFSRLSEPATPQPEGARPVVVVRCANCGNVILASASPLCTDCSILKMASDPDIQREIAALAEAAPTKAERPETITAEQWDTVAEDAKAGRCIVRDVGIYVGETPRFVLNVQYYDLGAGSIPEKRLVFYTDDTKIVRWATHMFSVTWLPDTQQSPAEAVHLAGSLDHVSTQWVQLHMALSEALDLEFLPDEDIERYTEAIADLRNN